MKNELLSIGEVSKMKGVGVKSLRYYERLGILPPVYVDPYSRYRYYSMNQMIDIDIITTCVELGIPLKEVTQYIHEGGVLDIEPLLDRGREIAAEKLRRAQASLLQIDNCLDEIRVQKTLGEKRGSYRRTLGPRLAILTPWTEHAFDAKRYVAAMTELYNKAGEIGLVPYYLQGMVNLPDAIDPGWFAAVEVGAARDSAWADAEHIAAASSAEGVEVGPDMFVLMLPGGAFEGRRVVDSGFASCFEKVFEQAKPDRLTLALEVWDAETHVDAYVVECLMKL